MTYTAKAIKKKLSLENKNVLEELGVLNTTVLIKYGNGNHEALNYSQKRFFYKSELHSCPSGQVGIKFPILRIGR